jgi:APA family basic amino acid/polyamine antiporter
MMDNANRLKPQLSLFDAVATGLAAILGAGIFAFIAPAAAIAGPSLIIAFLIAAFVAFCNAFSSAQLAAVFPRSGGTYEFGKKMLGPWWGYAAGWMFLTANTVGPGVIALAFGGYLNLLFNAIPVRYAAVAIALVMTVINALGIRRSAHIIDIIVVLSVLSLLAFILLGLPGVKTSNFAPFAPGGIIGILEATGLLFFAYTGYSRIATLVEEVKNPKRTIPWATAIALGVATVLYMLVATTTVGVLGAKGVSASSSPLSDTLVFLGIGFGAVMVAVGALLTTFNEGLSDLLGVSRVAFAMGRDGDLPGWVGVLGAGQNPRRSVFLVGIVSILVAAFAPFGIAIMVSSFGTLLYYAIANLSALKLKKQQRMFPRWMMFAGLIGCLALAFSLATQSIIVGLVILFVGIVYRILRLKFKKKINASETAGRSNL